jgi:glycosyltransferase involved in cell wall biosynthesis
VKFAILHDLPSGGAKRALYEEVKRLSTRHTLGEFTLSTADLKYCDILPYIQKRVNFAFTPLGLFKSPFGRLNQFQRWRDLQRLDRLGERIAREIDGQGYDGVFAHPCQWTQSPLVIRHLRTPVVYYLQEPPRQLYPEDWTEKAQGWRAYFDKVDPLRRLYRTSARKLDKSATRASKLVLVNSKFMRERVQRIYDLTPEVCYLGVDVGIFHPMEGLKKENYILSVGAIHQSKGFDFIIRSLGLIRSACRPPLRLVGSVTDPLESDRLSRIAQECGVELMVEVDLSNRELVERYNQARLFVYAPYEEPFGLAPLEAMACGTPVVGVAEGGVSETIVDGVTGRLVSRDPKQMAQVVEWLLDHVGECFADGERVVEHVAKNWSWEAAAARIETHLLSAVK